MTTPKTILLTGATDGIGLAATKIFAGEGGHTLLLHGRDESRLKKLATEFKCQTYCADLADMDAVRRMADAVAAKHKKLDVLINNAGVLKTADTITKDGLDIRFAVNTLAPYLLTKLLLPLFNADGRIINIASRAQATPDMDALTKADGRLEHFAAYSQSKLAIIMWSMALAADPACAPSVLAVNPGSLLASKMVREGFGIDGKDISIGAKILHRTALADAFAHAAANGKYWCTDNGVFKDPDAEALDAAKCAGLVRAMEAVLAHLKSAPDSW